MAKDKELADHERAHSGQPGANIKHGANATQVRYKLQRRMANADSDEDLTKISRIAEKHGLDH